MTPPAGRWQHVASNTVLFCLWRHWYRENISFTGQAEMKRRSNFENLCAVYL
jgi:hypothetical protein